MVPMPPSKQSRTFQDILGTCGNFQRVEMKAVTVQSVEYV